jgi:hypothetical protein
MMVLPEVHMRPAEVPAQPPEGSRSLRTVMKCMALQSELRSATASALCGLGARAGV